MQELFAHPAVQGGVAPFLAGIVVAVALFAVRLAGLAAIAGFAVAVWLIGAFALEPLTATRKLAVVGALAAGVGLLADFAFKPTRATAPVLGALFGAASLWVFWSVLAQKPLAPGLLYGAGTALFVGWCVAFALSLQADSVRAGAAGLGMGLGAGFCALFGASGLLAQYGISVGAACGGFLLVVMILGRRVGAGASFALPAAVIASLVVASTLYLAQLSWYALGVLALVPVAARLPLPNSAPWLQSFVASFYTLATAGVACFLAWQASRS